MKITHSQKGPERFANGRVGREYTLVPETEEDQTFVSQLHDMLRQRKFRRVDKSQIIDLGSTSSIENPSMGKEVYLEYRIGIYEPAQGFLRKLVGGQ